MLNIVLVSIQQIVFQFHTIPSQDVYKEGNNC